MLCETVSIDELAQIPETVIKEQLASYMADQLLRRDLIEWRRETPWRAQMAYAMTGTCLIAPRSAASNIEDFAKDRAAVMVREVIDAAGREIDNWNSYFGHSEILKHDARRLMSEAMQRTLNRLERAEGR